MVFDLDLMSQYDESWRKLILERSKNARLCISGTIRGGHFSFDAFFVNLLHNHWPRIRRLDVFVGDHYLLETDAWDIFQQPALQLEIFKLYFEEEGSALFSDPDSPIFANNAPVLREFMFPDTSTKYMSLQAPWLRQLRSLVMISGFGASELLETLRELPQLEYLELRESILEPVDCNASIVCLPNIRKLTISNTLSTSLFFLKHITLSPGASINLLTEERMDTHDRVSDSVVDEVCGQISRYTKNYINNDYGLAKSIFVKIGPPTFAFKMRKTANELIPMPSENDFRIGIFSNHLSRDAVPKMMACLDPRQFTETIRLEFIPYMIDIIEDAQPTITSLLRALSSVKVMMTSENGLRAFMNAQSEYPDILPAMDTFWLKYIEPTSERFPQLLLDFLHSRRDAGKPVTTINISDSSWQFKEKLDWGYLEVIDGLTVILRHDSQVLDHYTCGTGNPKTLDMRTV
ncbi:hypothetical protein JR316_0012225 [Psilocybe cubensis]|uniref:Uncharacterized protein n=2 Tax=Psilocybe cubensis TaxID=181762 RepID=A0ACB8GJ70_PSICU|nr:hypothetical protein JR316_0012225 [Psilocybe cubensis]KAH9475114.1 hypothetical protein JR316_0012225 [Psilocybe cubensis]